ncbi:uncharacterized protein SCHCODRAFT_02329142 [Schizophyllum commune H4-8]|uniref:uncharacterized protein n=1 Tax=Schizophyllum commune (strain H4-8 / FGSC 9210) TaxID=578458 RepID=UPI00215DFDEF|nr:uncharacterized protein SCHCODRAFT_02329142 [Schizophyllum commune H4-8]KAI5891794.1 hypothetical protein SCHCODRAFT_02329142 [Schizophyllum commune H4-8]
MTITTDLSLMIHDCCLLAKVAVSGVRTFMRSKLISGPIVPTPLASTLLRRHFGTCASLPLCASILILLARNGQRKEGRYDADRSVHSFARCMLCMTPVRSLMRR